jgi:hypothetical protein
MGMCQYYKCDNPSCKIDGCWSFGALPEIDIEEPYDPPSIPQKQLCEDDIRRIIKDELKIFAEFLKKDHDGFWK